ncbi:MAG TPA: hypothetical protein DD706_10110, partial [Nitrospiraceae bacterium]|nr:hypothetical protein [Nitrospiraceae bacterium]
DNPHKQQQVRGGEETPLTSQIAGQFPGRLNGTRPRQQPFHPSALVKTLLKPSTSYGFPFLWVFCEYSQKVARNCCIR